MRQSNLLIFWPNPACEGQPCDRPGVMQDGRAGHGGLVRLGFRCQSEWQSWERGGCLGRPGAEFGRAGRGENAPRSKFL